MAKNRKMSTITRELEDIFVSVVIVADRDIQELGIYLEGVSEELAIRYANYEILLVNNGAGREEIVNAMSLLERLPCIRIISLSQRTRYDTAVFAGLEGAIGDYVCTVNPSVDPIKDIHKIVTLNQKHNVVQGISGTPVTGVFGSRTGRNLFYWYNRKYINIDIPLNATYFASYNRRAVNALTSAHRNHRHIRHLVRLIGFEPAAFIYQPKQNPSSQRSLRTSVVEALEIATSYSTHPLRFVTWLGVLAGLMNVGYIGYILILNITSTRVAEGWTTTSLQLSGMFFILFIIMVILAEYIGRILVESRQEPQYYITDESTSTVSMADASRRNITGNHE